MSASHMKKHTSFSQDLHPKPEITDTFDLFLNTDLCECVFPCVDNGMKKKEEEAEEVISRTRNLITLSVQRLLCCVKHCTDTQMYTALFAFTGRMYVHIHSCGKDTKLNLSKD